MVIVYNERDTKFRMIDVFTINRITCPLLFCIELMASTGRLFAKKD